MRISLLIGFLPAIAWGFGLGRRFAPPVMTTSLKMASPSMIPKSLTSSFHIGVSMNIVSFIYTTHHYSAPEILSFDSVLLQFLIATCVYGKDRLYDAYEYKRRTKPDWFSFWKRPLTNDMYDQTKIALYQEILKYSDLYENLYSVCFCSIAVILFSQGGSANTLESIQCLILYFIALNSVRPLSAGRFLPTVKLGGFPFPDLKKKDANNFSLYKILFPYIFVKALGDYGALIYLPFLLLLESTNDYITLKKKYGLLKPFYVSSMWTMGTVVLPCVLHDHNYRILQDYGTCASSFLLLFSLTNMMDIMDVNEDRLNQIETIPVRFGRRFTYLLSGITFYMACSVFL